MDIDARQPMSHTAGPDASVASAVVEIWNSIAAQARAFNTDHERVFDQLSPSLRRFVTATTPEMEETVDAQIAWRLPMDFDAERLVTALLSDVARILEGTAPAGDGRDALRSATVRIQGATTNVALVFSGWERAWRGDRQNALARSFLSAIRRIDSSTPPGVLVKTGTSDMNVVAPVWGCPVVAYGPGDSALDHTPREHLAIAEYLTAIAVLEAALRTLVASL
jgi:LysW-gamma-L-lysine carboxypeptidase